MLSTRLIQSKPLLILREAFSSLLPIILMMNILVLVTALAKLLEWGGGNGLIALNNEVNRLYIFLIPLFLNLTLSTLLAKEKDLDQIGTLLISMVCFFRISGYLTLNEKAELVSYDSSVFSSIPATFGAVTLLHYFSKFPQFQFIRYQIHISSRLKKTLNLLIPGFLTILGFEIIYELLRVFLIPNIFSFFVQVLPNLKNIGEIPELLVYKTICQLSWFFGVHGEHSAHSFFHLIHQTPAGSSTAIRLQNVNDAFMNIGGSGSTFIIPFLILFTKQAKQFKTIAKISLPFALFNVNEILLFGLPILLNPVFWVPFFLAPLANMAIALSAIHYGLFTMVPQTVHWMVPPLYSAYIATDGSPWAVLTNLLCIIVDGLIYLPFLIIARQQWNTPLHLLNVLGEEANDPFLTGKIDPSEKRLFLTQQTDSPDHLFSENTTLEQLKGGQFLVYFQPKVNTKSLKLVGIEALIRFRNANGDVLLPNFLPILYEQGLSKAVDKKMVNLVLEQVLRWREQGLSVPPISVNFDKDFLLDTEAVSNFILQTQEHEVLFNIEITEHTYTVELETLTAVIRQLKRAGHLISIDDFGAGYSSLTTLILLEANEIKLDRKLVVFPPEEAERGKVLLESSVKLCQDLGFLVVAEGVETELQLRLLQDCGVDIIQGYLTGKPMDAQQVGRLFDRVGDRQFS